MNQILRQQTIDSFGYDPFSDEARSRLPVMVRRECCGIEMVMRRQDVAKYPECDTCSWQRRRAERKRGRSPVMTYSLQKKLIHNQWVVVKVYPTGLPADFLPKVLEEITDKG